MIIRKSTKRIIWHCTATPEGREVTYDDLWKWHVTDNGWSHIGYHYLLPLAGGRVVCRPEQYQGAGVSGHNHDTVHISYAGGLARDGKTAKDTRTPEQAKELYMLTDELLKKYGLTWQNVHGHNEFAAKACPSFDVKQDLRRAAAAVGDQAPEVGNPEPGDPDLGPLALYLNKVEARLQKIEEHLSSFDQT